MAQFEGTLSVNNYNLTDRFNLKGFQIKANEETLFGINRSATFNEGVFEKNVDDKLPQILIELAKVDCNDTSIAFTDRELEELLRILYKNDIACITYNGLNYYGTFTMGSKMLFGNSNQGYISLQFQSCSPYCYTSLLLDSVKVIGEKTIDVYNNSNVKDMILIDAEIEKIGDGDIIITNTSMTNNSMKLKNLVDGEIIKIYGEECNEITTSISNKNIFNLMEGNFIKLRYGLNRIKVTGNCRINILRQECRIIQ